MIKVLSCRFHKGLVPFNMLAFKECSETTFLESGLTKSFTVCNFGNARAIKIIFFSLCSKLDVDFRNGTKNSKNGFRFYDNCLWIGRSKFQQSRTGYLSLAVNVLTNTPKISHITKGDVFHIRFSQSVERIWWKCSHRDFASVWDPLICWPWKRFLKRIYLESVLTKSFTVCNFGNTRGMTIIFSFEMFKIGCRFEKWNKKFRKINLFWRKLLLNWEQQILTIRNRILVIRSQCVNNHP